MGTRSVAAAWFYGVATLLLGAALAVMVVLLRDFEREMEGSLDALGRVFSDESVLRAPGDPSVRFAAIEDLAAKYENIQHGGTGYVEAITITKVFAEGERVVYPFYYAAFVGDLPGVEPRPGMGTDATAETFHGHPLPRASARVREIALESPRGEPVGRLFVLLNPSNLVRVRMAIGFLSALLVGSVALLVFQFRRQEQVISATTVELEEKRRELVRLERLALAGQLSAGILHDLKKPVLNIKNELEEPPSPDMAQGLRGQVDTFFAILRDSSLERLVRTEGEREYVDVNEMLQRSLALVRYECGGVENVVRLDPSLPPVLAVPVRLLQVFSNLILNAYQAMDGAGSLTVSSRRGEGGVVVSVEDSGPGIPPDLLASVFTPFFTTKPADKGTGLGLYITRDIVRDMGGDIRVESRPGRTLFEVLLPAGE